MHAFPKADVSVVQLSIHARRDFDSHFELGVRLSPLRERGVLIVGSGSVVHNLRALNWAEPELGFDCTRRFDEARRPLEVLVDGHAFGSLSMAAYTLDAQCPTDDGDSRPSAGLPDPSVTPAEDANI